MKIAYLANIRFPSERAHATQIVHNCQAFAQNGAVVDLIVNRRRKENISEIGKYFNIDPAFSLIRISHSYFSSAFKLFFHISSLLFCVSFLLRVGYRKYDVIFSREEWILWLLSFFVPKEYLVWESHEAKINYPARRLFKRVVKVVVISEGIFNEYIKFGLQKEKMLVAHDGIDGSFFEALESKEASRKRLELGAEDKIAMYIGGFDTWKGVETFFAASGLLPAIKFVAIGGTAEQVLSFSKRYPDVIFLGQQPYPNLRHNQQAADVLVIPNSGATKLSANYTSPLKLFAHMTSGVPMVVSDLPSLVTVTGRDLVTAVEPDSPSSLVEGIETIFSHYEAKKLSAQALSKASIRYTWYQRAKYIINFISH